MAHSKTSGKIDIPAVSAATMRAADDLAEGRYRIHLLQMMENAGRSLARLARDQFLAGSAADKEITILAGPGGNGGGGLAAARRLHGWGARVQVVSTASHEEMPSVPARQLQTVQAFGIPVHRQPVDFSSSDLLLDALLGYSTKGDPRPPISELIEAANNASLPVLALDLPSGLGPDDGIPGRPCIKAAATLALALPKQGLLAERASDYVGQLWLADLGLPAELFAEVGVQIQSDLFTRDDLLRLL